MGGAMKDEHTPSSFTSHLSHAYVTISLPSSVACTSGIYDQTFSPPHRVWGFPSKWFRSYTCWVLEHIVIFSMLFEGKELVHRWQKDAWISPLRWAPWNAFLSTSWCSDLAETLSFYERGKKYESSFERPPYPPWFSEPCDSFDCHLSSSFTPGFVGPHFSFPVCLYYMAYSSWHILLALSDRLEGVKSLWVLFLILLGQQAYFQR